MKLISWNVNGLRAVMKKNFFDFLEKEQPDVLCLQETKMQEGQADVPTEGYFQFWCSAEKKGYSGTLTLSRTEPLSVSTGMGVDEHDHEGRIVTLEFPEFYSVNVYVPNSQNELARLDYRMRWEEDFLTYIKTLEKKKPVVICGDMNVAHKEIDLKNPSSNHHNAGFTDEERERMTLLQEAGLIDTFRYFHPDEKDRYSWWSYRFNARANNAGWRIDYFLVSEALKKKLVSADILSDVPGSDHCPVTLEIKTRKK